MSIINEIIFILYYLLKNFNILFYRQVLEVIAGVKDQPSDKLAEIFYDNTVKLFFNKTK